MWHGVFLSANIGSNLTCTLETAYACEKLNSRLPKLAASLPRGNNVSTLISEENQAYFCESTKLPAAWYTTLPQIHTLIR